MMQKSYSLTQWSATASAVAYKTAKAVLLQSIIPTLRVGMHPALIQRCVSQSVAVNKLSFFVGRVSDSVTRQNDLRNVGLCYVNRICVTTNNEVAIATIFESGIRTRRRDTFFCAAKRKYPKKRRLDCRFVLRSSVLSGVGREGFLPSYRLGASMSRPFGLIPTKPAVLSATNESKTTLLRNISL